MKTNLIVILACLALASCGALRTFHDYARAGDSVAVPVGMQPNFNKDNITVTITPFTGAPVVYSATDPAIRGIVNLYPDPVSSMTTSRNIGEDVTPFAQTYADSILFSTNTDKDYYQTTVFIDLPPSIATGLAQVEVTDGITSYTSELEVIPGVGVPNPYNSDIFSGLLLDENMLDSMSRSGHTVVTFDTTTTVPNAIEINLSHDPDSTVGGSGKAFVVNPLGHRKNIVWKDDGTNMKIILTEAKQGIIDNILDYKFYVSGTATNLAFVSVAGYDTNGNVVTGITSTLTPH